jgi:hypothetical protein
VWVFLKLKGLYIETNRDLRVGRSVAVLDDLREQNIPILFAHRQPERLRAIERRTAMR